MRTITILFAAVLLACAFPRPASADPVDLRVMTFNVLVHWETKEGVPRWERRQELCLQVVKDANLDLLGLQEAAPKQTDFFRDNLPGYGLVGELPLTGDELETFSEILPIAAALRITRYTDALLFYREEIFEKLDQGHWWLSSTPDRVSADFGNAMPRVMVWAKLRHKPSGRELIAAVTHFDNTLPSQIHMAALAHDKLQPFVEQGLPVIFVGDFNTNPGRGDYAKLTEEDWTDAYLASSEASETGEDNNVPTSFHGGVRIDHILYHGAGLKAVEWRRVESPDPARPLSDHYPVFAVIRWE